MGWGFGDNTDHAAVAKAQSAADKRRADEAASALEWATAWDEAKKAARKVTDERIAAARAADVPPPTDAENLAAIRKLLEAQARGGSNA